MSLIKDPKAFLVVFSNLFSNIGINLTFLGIPWYLAQTYGGHGTTLGAAMLAGTVFLFFLNPLFGGLIDTKSRKKLILTENLAGFFILSTAAIMFISTSSQIVILTAVYIFCGIIRAFHYSNLAALNQELFRKQQYAAVSSITEIEGQMSVIVSGAFGAYAITHFDLTAIFGLDAFSYGIAFAMLAFLPYEKTYQADYKAPSYFKDIKAGIGFVRQYPKQIFLFLSLSLPFLVRGLTTLILPYYVALHLHGSGNIYGFSQTTYGIGAIISGLTVTVLVKKWGTSKILVNYLLLFGAALTMLSLSTIETLAIMMQFFMGMAVSSVRISRNTMMMEQISKKLMGRVNSLLDSVITGIDLVLTGLITLVLAAEGPAFAYGILVIILLLSAAGVVKTLSAKTTRIKEERL